MKHCELSRHRPHFGLALARLLIFTCLLAGSLLATEHTKSKRDEPASNETTPSPKRGQKKPPKQLSGAELYALHCNRCHPERYAPERTADQWKTILVHMRTRANLPAAQAKAILQFLQEDSGK